MDRVLRGQVKGGGGKHVSGGMDVVGCQNLPHISASLLLRPRPLVKRRFWFEVDLSMGRHFRIAIGLRTVR